MAIRTNTNNRLFYGVTAVGLTATGNSQPGLWRQASGVQSVGIDTSFELEQVFQLGQLGIYSNVENIPNVEVTLEKVLDGTALIQHLATPYTGLSADLIGRYGNSKCDLAVNFYKDTLSAASGGVGGNVLGVHQCIMSGMYVSSIGFNLGVDGNFTETVSLVGNNKGWRSSAGQTFVPNASGVTLVTSPPTGFISRRQHLVFGTGNSPTGITISYLPTEIPGINLSGWNLVAGTLDTITDYEGFGAHIQSVQVSADLGRTELFELGKKGPYHRYLDFPIEVTCAIEVIDTQGDSVTASADATNNSADQRIYLVINDGTTIDLGSKNRLTSVSSSAGDTSGGNRTLTYNYTNFNALVVTRWGLAPGTQASTYIDPSQATDNTAFDEFGTASA